MRYCFLTICVLVALFSINPAFGDVVYLKDGSQLKGIIVEEYSDRITLSTIDGETQILNKDIDDIQYDEAYQNLVALGRQYELKDNFLKASEMYTRALKIKPDSQDIKNSLTYAKGKLLRQVDLQMKKDIEKKEQIFKIAGKKMPQQAQTTKPPTDKKTIIWASLGIEPAEEKETIIIKNIRYGSPAWAEGIKSGDSVVAIWGRLTGYLSLQEVIDLLSESTLSEVNLTIHRDIDLILPYVVEKISGAEFPGFKLEIKEPGLTVIDVSPGSIAQQAGLKTGDLVFEINDKPTRYMMLKDTVKLINTSKNSGLSLTVRRQLTLWRK